MILVTTSLFMLALSVQIPTEIRQAGTQYSTTKTPNQPYGKKITQVSEMQCNIYDFKHDTRSLTCVLNGNDTNYEGNLTVEFTDKTTHNEYVFVEQTMLTRNGAEVLEYWGICSITIVNEPGKPIKGIQKVYFTLAQPTVEWTNPYPIPTTKQTCFWFFHKWCREVTVKENK